MRLGDIEFRKVVFAYPSRPSAVVLDEFSLTIKQGKIIALAGPSGLGKSTISQVR
jgi:ABC-type multidrug transport system fused ATPase/permease subunit